MGSENVEQLWYGLCLIEAVVALFVLSVVVLLCKRFLHAIPWNRIVLHSARHQILHSFGTVQPPRTANPVSCDIKTHWMGDKRARWGAVIRGRRRRGNSTPAAQPVSRDGNAPPSADRL